MNYLQHKISIIVVVFFMVVTSQVGAEEFTCWLAAPEQDDIWVDVYIQCACGALNAGILKDTKTILDSGKIWARCRSV